MSVLSLDYFDLIVFIVIVLYFKYIMKCIISNLRNLSIIIPTLTITVIHFVLIISNSNLLSN